DFQTARINDRMNQESDIYAESRDHIYNDLEISDLPRLSEADDSEELLNSSLLDTKDGTQTPPHQITGNTSFAQSTASETHESILKASSENLTGLDDAKSLTEDGPKKTIYDWVRTTNALIVVNDKDTEESFLKPIPDISASNSSEHHYWSEFGHRFFSYALQEFAVYKVVEGKCADLLAWSWETGEEIFVGEQAGPPTKPDLTKLSMDSFKLYRELRDCLNVRILNAMKIGDVNYTNRAV
ncbi:15655_t:CDS:2, partial [Racocetra fulgida]